MRCPVNVITLCARPGKTALNHFSLWNDWWISKKKKSNRNTSVSSILLCCFPLLHLPKPSCYLKKKKRSSGVYFLVHPICNNNDGDSWYLLSNYCTQGMELSTLHILIHLKLTTALRGQYCSCFCFPDTDICPRSTVNKR